MADRHTLGRSKVLRSRGKAVPRHRRSHWIIRTRTDPLDSRCCRGLYVQNWRRYLPGSCVHDALACKSTCMQIDRRVRVLSGFLHRKAPMLVRDKRCPYPVLRKRLTSCIHGSFLQGSSISCLRVIDLSHFLLALWQSCVLSTVVLINEYEWMNKQWVLCYFVL